MVAAMLCAACQPRQATLDTPEPNRIPVDTFSKLTSNTGGQVFLALETSWLANKVDTVLCQRNNGAVCLTRAAQEQSEVRLQLQG